MQSYNISPILQLMNPTNTIYANRCLAHAIGMNETIIYSALISKFTYYSFNNMECIDGWFYSTVIDLQESTTYGEKAQRRAINNLVNFKLIETRVKGVPAKRYFRITDDISIIEKLISKGEVIAKNLIRLKSASSNAKLSSAKTAELDPPNENYDNICLKSTSNNVESSSSETAELDPSKRRNWIYPNGGTSSVQMADKSKDNNHNLNNHNLNQSIIPSDNHLSGEIIMTDGQTDLQQMDYSEILLVLGYDWRNKLFQKPVNDSTFKDFDDNENISKCSIPYNFKDDKRTLTLALKFLCSYSYYTPTMTPESTRLLNTVISSLAEMINHDFSVLQGRKVGYYEIIDKLNEIVRTSSLIDWFFSFEKEWYRILQERESDIKNQRAYLKTCIWNWLNDFDFAEDNQIRTLELM